MKTLAVVGSRSFKADLIAKEYAQNIICWELLNEDKDFGCFVSGGADGPDKWGEECAHYINCLTGLKHIDIKIYKPDWQKYGKSAGFKRNGDIVHDADYVLVFWDGVSKGTQHDITLCQGMGTDYDVYLWGGPEEGWRKGGDAYAPLTDATVNA